MTKERLDTITDKYNAKIHDFDFPTVPASCKTIKSILNIHPSWEELEDEKIVYRIAIYLNYFAFCWN